MHAIYPIIRFLTKFPAHSILPKGEYHYSPLLSSVNLQTILLRIHSYGACTCGQVNLPARQSALGTPIRRRVAARLRIAGAALSTSTQSRSCPCRAHRARSARCAQLRVPRALRSVPRAARTLWSDCRAPRKPPSPNLNPSRRAGRSFSPNARQSAPSNVCPPISQRLPPDLRICCKQVQPASPSESSTGPQRRRPRPPPPARTGIALLRRPAQASPSSAG